MSNIKKELNGKVKDMVDEDNVLITEIPKDINKYIKRQKQAEIKNLKGASSNYDSKQKIRQLKLLKEDENILRNNLKKIEQNEKLLQDEGFVDLTNSRKGYPIDSKLDKTLKEQELKNVQQKKENINIKIKNIESRIMNIMEEEQPLTMNQKRKLYIENFERDREIAETRAQKYLKESRDRSQRMQNDISQLVEKRKKEIEEKDKQDKILREEMIKKFKEKEKAIEEKHSKLNGIIVDKYKSFVHQNLHKKGKDYKYSKIYEKYLKTEEKKLKKKEEEIQEYVNQVKMDELNEFTKKVDEKREKDVIKREQKRVKLTENWKKNKENLPKCNFEVLCTEENKEKEEEDKKKEENQERVLVKINYSEKIRKKKMPEVAANLRKEREKNIMMVEDPKYTQKKYTMKKQKKNRIILKKRDTSKPSKFKWELKLKEDTYDKIEEEVSKNIIKKPRKVNLSPIPRTKSFIPDTRPDYLTEMIHKKQEKMRANSSKIKEDDQELNTNAKSLKWEKAINDDSGNLMENINDVKQKASILEKNAERNEKLLKLNGGIENNPELGKKVSSLLLDSIAAKLSILKKVNNE